MTANILGALDLPAGGAESHADVPDKLRSQTDGWVRYVHPYIILESR